MPSDSKAQHPPSEQEHLPCPRCDSTNTKFCYYNNYNFSQPRHFCKSCRRYWTHGGTLRDIPVGGGTRKNAKRSRTTIASATSSSSAATPMMTTLPAISTPLLLPLSTNQEASTMHFDGSFSSLFGNNTGEPSGFLALGGGFGLGLGPGFEDLYGLGRGGWVDGGGSNIIGDGAPVVASSWHHLESGEGGFVNGERFSWPGLAISTHGNCLK